MSAPLSREDEERYTAIIDAILETADLQTVTRKKIRQGLEKALGGKDTSENKEAIKRLIQARFDDAVASAATTPPAALPPSSMPDPSPNPSPKRQANGHFDETEDADEVDGEIEVSTQPAKKKQKRSASTEEADAKLAAELQAQENRMARSRTTRGGGGNKVVKKKKKAPRKKSEKKVKGDDSEDGSEDSAAPKRKAGGGFQKPFTLSYPLAAICGESKLSRPQVVKKLWEHIKANELQDPKDKRQIRCDELMQAVFKQAKVDMFQMNKIIGNHLYPVEEE